MVVRLIEWSIPYHRVTLAGGGVQASTRPLTMKANLIDNNTGNRVHQYIKEQWLKTKGIAGNQGTQQEAFWEGRHQIPRIDGLAVEITAINTMKDTTGRTFDRDIVDQVFPLPLGSIVLSIHGWVRATNNVLDLDHIFKGSIIYDELKKSRFRGAT